MFVPTLFDCRGWDLVRLMSFLVVRVGDDRSQDLSDSREGGVAVVIGRFTIEVWGCVDILCL